MKTIEILKMIPKAVWSYLKATYNAISENLQDDKPQSFEEIYVRISKCKDCPARKNDTCMACGCNCFVKCELDGCCPLWDASDVSQIIMPETVKFRADLGKYEVSCDKKLSRYPFIVYTDSNGEVQTLILPYYSK